MPFTPSLRLAWNFAEDKSFIPRKGPRPVSGVSVSVDRNSEATYYDEAGVLQTAGVGEVRFDHDPATLTSLGLLLEDSRTNLLLQSEAIDNATWTKTRTSAVANATVAPDGNTTADELVEDSTPASSHFCQQDFTVNVSTDRTISVFIKRGSGARQVYVDYLTPDFVNVIRGNFDLDAGVVGPITTQGAPQNVSSRIQSLQNGWFRVSISGLLFSGGTTETARVRIGLNETVNTEPPQYDGDGTSSLYVWGTQIERDLVVTSYIPTASTSVARAADVPVGTSNVDALSPQQGTLYGQYILPNYTFPGPDTGVLVLDDLTTNNRIGHVATSTANGQIEYRIATGGVQQASETVAGGDFTGVTQRHALAFASNDMQGAQDGTLSPVDNALTVPPFAAIACNVDLPVAWYQEIRFYDERFDASSLQDLTNGLIDEAPSYPGTYSPDLALCYNFAVDQTLYSRDDFGPALTFTRAGAATYYDSAGVLKTALNDNPRFDHDPSTLAPLGLLVEASSQNSLEFSQDMTQWGGGGTPVVSVSPNPSPDGLSNLYTIEDDDAGAFEWIRQTGSVFLGGANDIFTASIFVRKDSTPKTVRWCELRLSWTSPNVRLALQFDTSTGEFATEERDPGSQIDEGRVEDYGDFWRVSITGTRTVSASGNGIVDFYPAIGSGPNFGSGFYDASVTGSAEVFGAQLELSPIPTSYIATAGSAVTREEDRCLTTDNTWYTQAFGSFYHAATSVAPAPASGSHEVWNFDDGSNAHRINIRQTTGENEWQTRILRGGGTQAQLNTPVVINDGTLHRQATAAEQDDVQAYVDGVASPAETSSNFPINILDNLRLGANSGAGVHPQIWFDEFRHYTTRRADTGAGSLDELSQGLINEPETGTPDVVGDLDATNADDTAALTGTVEQPTTVTGDLDATNAGDTAALTGTVETPFQATTGGDTTVNEATVVAGTWSTTITLTSIGDEWVPAGPAFDAVRQDIINGFSAATSPANGWNDEVRDKEVVTAVVRTSDTVVTLNWSPSPLYDITNNEQVNVVVPDSATVGVGTGPSTPPLLITTTVLDVFTVREVTVSNLGNPAPTPAVPTTGTHDVPLPSPIVTGDLLIMMVGFRGNQAAPTGPVGWTELNTELSFSTVRTSIFAKYADGTEGTTAQVLSDGFRWGQAHVYRFDKDYVFGSDVTTDIAIERTKHEGTDGGAGRQRNPPANTAPWGSEVGNMWICGFCFNQRYVGQYYPTGFTYGREIDNGTGAGSDVFQVTWMSCYTFDSSATVDPDVIGVPLTTSDFPRGTSYTIAIRGKPAISPIVYPFYLPHGIV